jgi:phosphate transport system substrate-binding protein
MRIRLGLTAAVVAALLVTFVVTGTPTHADKEKDEEGTVQVDKNLEKYEAVPGISGNISSVGSDTLNNLMTLWAEGFREHYPNVRVSVEGKGTSTAPPALIEGVADIGPMSRPMREEEVDAFERRFGYRPSYVGVSFDALAVYVHRDNPIEKLTLQQVDSIFSQTRRGGHPEDVTKWGQVGMRGEWANNDIVLYGRNSASGTYGFFREKALFRGDFKATVQEQPGSAAVVQSVSVDRNGIGYSGIGYRTAGVRAVPLAKDANSEAYGVEAENVHSGNYPLARFLYLYFNRPPGQEMPALVREFLTFVHSQEGQQVVVRDGYIPLNKRVVDRFAPQYK